MKHLENFIDNIKKNLEDNLISIIEYGSQTNTENSQKLFTSTTAFIRVLLQVGPGPNGSLWFDNVSVTKN